MFKGVISAQRYGWNAAARIGIYAGLQFGFPFITLAIVMASGCLRIEGACGAVAIIVGVYLKPLIHIVFALSMTRISIARARDAGLPAWLGLCAPALILGDLGFAIAFSSFWGARFALGILSVPAPWFLLTALGCVIALTILPTVPPASGARGSRALDRATIILIGLVLLSVAFSLTLFVSVPRGLAPRNLAIISTLARVDPRSYLRSFWHFLPIAAFIIAIAAASVRRIKTSAARTAA